MELYLDPVWVKPKKERKPHPLKGKHQWPTDDPEKRARIMNGLRKGWYSKNKRHKSPLRVPVSVYDLDGNYVTTCLHVKEAAEKYGNGSPGNVHNCISGRQGRIGQYQFRRANVVEFQGEKLVKKTPIEPYKRRSRYYYKQQGQI